MFLWMDVVNLIANSIFRVLWIIFYFWIILIVYNIISALFGLFILRRYYLNILRNVYRVNNNNNINICLILTRCLPVINTRCYNIWYEFLQLFGIKSAMYRQKKVRFQDEVNYEGGMYYIEVKDVLVCSLVCPCVYVCACNNE